MKIAFILPKYLPAVPIGGYRVVYEIAKGLAQRGHQVHILYPARELPFMEAIVEKELSLTDKLRKLYGKLVAYRDAMMENEMKVQWLELDESIKNVLVIRIDPMRWEILDAIVATAWQTAELLWSEGQELSARKFYLVQHYETWSGPKERVDATWQLPFKKIVVSEWLKNLAAEFGDNEAVKVPPGIDFRLFRVLRPVKEREKVRIGLVYHRWLWKGGSDAFRALEIVRSRLPKIKLEVLSVHPPDSSVPSWVDYHLNPPQECLPEFYNNCAIFVSSSWMEGFGLPGAEAMACGCALATTDSLGVREYAIDGETALVSPPRDPERLAENIIRLMEDDDLRIRIASQGNEFVKRFTWERTVDLFEEALRTGVSG